VCYRYAHTKFEPFHKSGRNCRILLSTLGTQVMKSINEVLNLTETMFEITRNHFNNIRNGEAIY
jgi:hypothetical protein